MNNVDEHESIFTFVPDQYFSLLLQKTQSSQVFLKT